MNVIFRKDGNETGRAGRNEMAVRAAPEANAIVLQNLRFFEGRCAQLDYAVETYYDHYKKH